MKIERALISVSNKDGVVDLARSLRKRKIEIISTGGTARLLEENNIKVTTVSDYTGFPEILGGRVKTLHPKIYGALLAKHSDPAQVESLKEFGIAEIHMVVVNLYPFEEVISKRECTFADAIENIDIGGVSLLRAASKNYRDVVVVTNPKDYPLIVMEMDKNNGEVSEETRLRSAIQAFSTTSRYDRLISNYLYQYTSSEKDQEKLFPPIMHLRYRKIRDLRYGENPHQDGALYIDEAVVEPSITRAEVHWGKELSFNNIYDLNSALELVREFKGPACVIVKHNNPCGVGQAKSDIAQAYERALQCDPVSAFGGIIAFNRKVTEKGAKAITKTFCEAVIAPDYDKKGLEVLKKKKNLRILTLPFDLHIGDNTHLLEKMDVKKIIGGILVQHRDIDHHAPKKWKVVTGKKVTPEMQDALEFSWKVCKHVKSNAIVIGNGKQTLGIGAGQMNRVEAVELALKKIPKELKSGLKGAVLASDAFFPFRDSIDRLKGLGIAAVVQPGGSVRDEEVIQAAKEHGITMLFTNVRHFKH